MHDEDQEKPEPRPIKYEDVDPFEAGWDTRIAFGRKFKYRVFFENDIGFKNGMQLDILRGWLEDNNCGVEGEDWVAELSDQPMEEFWNKGRTGQPEEIEARIWGNCIYINELSWLITGKLMEDPNNPDTLLAEANKYTAAKITVIQTAK